MCLKIGCNDFRRELYLPLLLLVRRLLLLVLLLLCSWSSQRKSLQLLSQRSHRTCRLLGGAAMTRRMASSIKLPINRPSGRYVTS